MLEGRPVPSAPRPLGAGAALGGAVAVEAEPGAAEAAEVVPNVPSPKLLYPGVGVDDHGE